MTNLERESGLSESQAQVIADINAAIARGEGPTDIYAAMDDFGRRLAQRDSQQKIVDGLLPDDLTDDQIRASLRETIMSIGREVMDEWHAMGIVHARIVGKDPELLAVLMDYQKKVIQKRFRALFDIPADD